MTWDSFFYFAAAAVLLWTFGAIAAWKGRERGTFVCTVAGLAVFAAYMPMPIVLLLTGLIFNKKGPKRLRDDDLSEDIE